ncbi:MAG: OmpA family protein [Armatimonas sp.]
MWHRDGKIFLAGSIPTQEFKDTLTMEAARHYGASGFVDKLTVASPAGSAEVDWETIALKSVVWGSLGDIAIDGKILTLRGKQPSADAKNKRYAYIKNALPTNWGLEDQMEAPSSSPSPLSAILASPTPVASPTPGSISTGMNPNDTTPPNLQKFKTVAFRPGSAELTDEGRTLLDEAAEVMATTGATRYEIGGNTDDTGADDANLNISERRADAVRKQLMDQGIAPERLETQGYGETRPLAPNDNDTNRARNRRIEFTELK